MQRVWASAESGGREGCGRERARTPGRFTTENAKRGASEKDRQRNADEQRGTGDTGGEFRNTSAYLYSVEGRERCIVSPAPPVRPARHYSACRRVGGTWEMAPMSGTWI